MTLVWPFRPTDDVTETLEWKTDVIRCKRAEYRRSLRPLPRLEYRYKYQLDSVDYGVARELARTIGGDDVFIPDWPNAKQIATIGAGTSSLSVDATYAPAYRVGGSVLVYVNNSSYEVVTVSNIGSGTITVSATASAHTNPWVIPLRLGNFTQEFSGDRGPYDHSDADAVFQVLVTEDLGSASGGLTYPLYLGDPLITDAAEIINSARETHQREIEVLDSQVGLIHRYSLYSLPIQSSILAWTASDEAALWALRIWLHTRRGRWKQFWTSSWNKEVVVTADILSGDSSIQVADIGFASKYSLPVDIAVVNQRTGEFIPLRITSVSAGTAGNELLNFSGTFGSTGTWYVASGVSVSKLTQSRIDSDRIEIQHLPGGQGTMVVATKEVPVFANRFHTAFAVNFRTLDLYTLEEARDYVMGGVTYGVTYPTYNYGGTGSGRLHVGGGAGVMFGATAFYSHYATLSLLWANTPNIISLSSCSEVWIWVEVAAYQGEVRLGLGTIPVDLSSPLTFEAILWNPSVGNPYGHSNYYPYGGLANSSGLVTIPTPPVTNFPTSVGSVVIGIRILASGVAEVYLGGDILSSSDSLRASGVKCADLTPTTGAWTAILAGSDPVGISLSWLPDTSWASGTTGAEVKKLRVDYAT